MSISGRVIGDAHTAALEAFLEATPRLPHRGGGVNATAIARACGFDRQVLYKNSQCRDLLNARMAQEGLPPLAAPREKERPDQSVAPQEITSLPSEPDLSRPYAQVEGEATDLSASDDHQERNEPQQDARRIQQLMAANERLEQRLRAAETRILAMDAERHALRQRIERLAYLEQAVLSGRGVA